MRYSLITGLTCAALVVGLTPATAQTLMGARCAGFSTGGCRGRPQATAPKPKQKGPPGAVTVVNASAKTVTEVAITAGDKTATLSKPLAPKGAGREAAEAEGLHGFGGGDL